MKIKLFAILLSSILLSNCAMFQFNQQDSITIDITPKNSILLPPPSKLGLNENLNQIVSATYTDKDGKKTNYTTQTIVQIDDKHIVMVALAGWGGSLFKLDYDGGKITSSSIPLPNKNIGIKQSLTEFILSNAPISVVKSMFLNTNIHIVEKDDERLFIDQNDKKIITIKYSKNKDHKSVIVINNYFYHYIITITDIDT